MEIKDVIEVMQANALMGVIIRHVKTNAIRVWTDDPEFINGLFAMQDNVFAREFVNELQGSSIKLKCKHVASCYSPPRYQCVTVLDFKL